jgi:hypothetical protein
VAFVVLTKVVRTPVV